MTFLFSGHGTTSNTSMTLNDFCSSLQAASHIAVSSHFIASAYILGSELTSMHATLAHSALQGCNLYDETMGAHLGCIVVIVGSGSEGGG
jgi:hypothetical protein